MAKLGEGRHPSVEAAARWLIPNPNLKGTQLRISEEYALTAGRLLGLLKDGPQLVLMLHSLTTAKDQAVRQSIVDQEQ